jgi:hypothetical protein
MFICSGFPVVTLINLLIWPAFSVGCSAMPGPHLGDGAPAAIAIRGASRGQEKAKRSGKASASAAAQVESFVNVTLRLREDEKPEIIRITEVEGKLVERQGPASEYIYEITKDGKAYSVGFLPQGGFGLRGFGDPGDSRKEKKGETKFTTVILSIPNTSLDALRRGRIGLRIYKIKPGVELETISVDRLERLVIDKTASVRAELLGTAIAKDMKSRPD